MNRDLRRQLLTVIAVLVTFAANTAAVAIPLGRRAHFLGVRAGIEVRRPAAHHRARR